MPSPPIDSLLSLAPQLRARFSEQGGRSEFGMLCWSNLQVLSALPSASPMATSAPKGGRSALGVVHVVRAYSRLYNRLSSRQGAPPQVITQSVAPCLAGAKGSAAASTPNTLSTIHFDPYASSALRERARGSEPRSPLKVSSLRELGLAPTIKRRFFQDLCLGAPRAALRPTPARAKGPAQAKAKKTKEAKFKKSPRCARLREVLIPAPRGGQCV